MADPRRNRSSNRPSRPPAPLTGEIVVDEETAAALAIFNARLARSAEAERTQRRVDKATREKDQAAARVRALETDTSATAEARTEAAAAYKSALDTLERTKKGEPEPAAAEPEPEAEDAAETPADDSEAEAPADEPSADEPVDAVEPADAAPAIDETPPADS